MWCDMAVLRDGVNAPAKWAVKPATSWIWMLNVFVELRYECVAKKLIKTLCGSLMYRNTLIDWVFADDCFLDRGKGLVGVASNRLPVAYSTGQTK